MCFCFGWFCVLFLRPRSWGAEEWRSNFCHLAAIFFVTVSSGTTNWVMIEIIKIYGGWNFLEVYSNWWLGMKVFEPVANIYPDFLFFCCEMSAGWKQSWTNWTVENNEVYMTCWKLFKFLIWNLQIRISTKFLWSSSRSFTFLLKFSCCFHHAHCCFFLSDVSSVAKVGEASDHSEDSDFEVDT